MITCHNVRDFVWLFLMHAGQCKAGKTLDFRYGTRSTCVRLGAEKNGQQ
jgi:hypothetical protein